MNYSFSVAADSKPQAMSQVNFELASIISAQPSREAEARTIMRAAQDVIGHLREPGEDEHIEVSVSGSLDLTDAGSFNSQGVDVKARMRKTPKE